MKIIQREVRPSGRCVYRIAGMKLCSYWVRPVTRIGGTGRPVLVVRIPGDAVGIFCHYLVRSGALGDADRTMRISEQYFVSVALLSRCSCLLAGCVSGSVAAALLSKGFDEMRVYNLGCYR